MAVMMVVFMGMTADFHVAAAETASAFFAHKIQNHFTILTAPFNRKVGIQIIIDPWFSDKLLQFHRGDFQFPPAPQLAIGIVAAGTFVDKIRALQIPRGRPGTSQRRARIRFPGSRPRRWCRGRPRRTQTAAPPAPRRSRSPRAGARPAPGSRPPTSRRPTAIRTASSMMETSCIGLHQT